MSNILPFPTEPKEKPHTARLTTWRAVREFIFAGKATFTILNTATGVRYTYKFSQPHYKDPVVQAAAPYFVNLLTGQNNQYTYMATVLTNVDKYKLFKTRSSKLNERSTPWVAIQWMLNLIKRWEADHTNAPWPIGFQFWHEGKCARCARPLTDPKSIARGFGPLCDMLETERKEYQCTER